MRSRFDKYGFVVGLIVGLVIGVFTGSIAIWMAIGVVLGIAFTRARFGHKLPRNQSIEIIPPEKSVRPRDDSRSWAPGRSR